MSHYELMDRAYDLANEHKLTASERNVLLYLTHKTRKGDTCWPSLDLIASKTGVHKTNVSRIIGKLDRLNIVTKKTFRRAQLIVGRPTNEYRINWSINNILLVDHQYIQDDSYYINTKSNSKDDDNDSGQDIDMALKTSGRKDHPSKPAHADPDLYSNEDETPEDVVAEFRGKAMKPAQQDIFWRRIVSACFPGYKADTLTAKQAGMLKATFAHFGPEAIDFIEVILSNWESFSDEAIDDNAAYNKTKYPNLAFLSGNKAFGVPWARNALIEREQAVQLIASKTQSQHTIDKPVENAPTIEAVKPAPKEAPATLDEALAILNGGHDNGK